MQQDNMAIFTGHVVAIQGQMRLKSDKMTVYYHKTDDKERQETKHRPKKPGEGKPRSECD